MTDTIKYRKIRSLKEIINVSFLYFSKNAGSLFFIMLIYTMPFFVVSKFISHSLNSGDMSLMNFMGLIISFKYYKPLPLIILLLIYFTGVTVHNMVMNKHLVANEPLASGQSISSSDFKNDFLQHLKLHLPNMFFLGSCVSVLGFILMTAAKWLTGEITYGFTEDPLGFIVQFFPTIIVFLGALPLGGYFFMTSLFVSLRDNMGIFPALGKVWHYSKSNMRRVWMLSLFAAIIAYVCYFCILIPFRFVSNVPFMLGMDIFRFGTAYFMILNIFYTFFALVCLYVFQLMSIYQFASLEEKEEGHYIIQKIDQV
jgi:hypothetical protein